MRLSVVAAGLATVLGAAVAAAPMALAGPGVPAAARTATATARTATHTVTLVTGDKVIVRTNAKGAPSIETTPGPGRAGIPVLRWEFGGHTHVVPNDVAPLVAAKRLDERLFDVTALVADGFADDASGELPLIVQYAGTPAAAATSAKSLVAAAGARHARGLGRLRATALRQPRSTVGKLWSGLTVPAAAPSAGRTSAARTLASNVTGVWLDARSHLTLADSVPQIGAPAAWDAGYTGRGVKTAVLDTGYDPHHPDLQGVVTASRNFTTDDPADVTDTNGHGTHVASTIAGSGAASGGREKGVAPGAELLVGKVCPSAGSGTSCPDSMIVAGIDWAVSAGAKIISMSLGKYDRPAEDPVEQAVRTYSQQNGVLFVVAAGNSGPGLRTVESPGSSPWAFAVGAVNSENITADWSSRGPASTDDALKPDVTAPGVGIVAARAAGTGPDEAADEFYTRMSGTSMATPHVAGAAALVAGAHPDWTAEQIKAALRGTAAPRTSQSVFFQGAGRVDAKRAIDQRVLAEPSALSFGKIPSEDAGAQPVGKVVTYRNAGPGPVTLHLGVQSPAPAGTFTISPADLTVPAGGTAEATVTADLRGRGGQTFGGWVSATSDTGVLRTPVGATHAPPERWHDLDMIQRDGTSSRVWYSSGVTAINAETGEVFTNTRGTDNKIYLSAPDGEYTLIGVVSSYEPGPALGSFSTTLEVKPHIWLGAQNVRIAFDARRGERLTVTTPDADARPVETDIEVSDAQAAGTVSTSVMALPGTSPDVYLVPGSADEGLHVTLQVHLARPDGHDAFANSPYVYHLVRQYEGALPGPVQRFGAGELAAVDTTYAAQRAGDAEQIVTTAYVPNQYGGRTEIRGGALLDVTPPLTRIEYYSPGVQWDEWLKYTPPGTFSETRIQRADPVTYQPGKRYSTRWNGGVFGPAFRADGDHDSYRRWGILSITAAPFSDSTAGHGGEATNATGTVTLFVNGAQAESQQRINGVYFQAPETVGTYRVVMDASRTGVDQDLPTTRSTTAWTFTSGPDQEGPLPLMAVRFAAPLDGTNTAPGGQQFTIPLTVQRQRSAAPSAVTSLTVDVSYDDGATWDTATVTRDGDADSVSLTHPPASDTPAFVSLRAKATDADGNSVEETLIRAYRLR